MLHYVFLIIPLTFIGIFITAPISSRLAYAQANDDVVSQCISRNNAEAARVNAYNTAEAARVNAYNLAHPLHPIGVAPEAPHPEDCLHPQTNQDSCLPTVRHSSFASGPTRAAADNVLHIQPIDSKSPCSKIPTTRCDPTIASCPRIDVRYKVTKIPQTTKNTCWAAAIAQLNSKVCISDTAMAQLTGHGSSQLSPSEVDRLLGSLGLVRDLQSLPPDNIADLLRQYGPLVLITPGHARVITGISGDGTSQGTLIYINDPLPMGTGSEYTLRYSDLGLFYVAHPVNPLLLVP